MGKDFKNKHFRNRNQKPYNKDNWKNQKPHGQQRSAGHQRPAGNRQHVAQIPKVTLRENQVGITEFTSDCQGFTAVFKSRYSDFHVNEIDTNGKVLILDDLTVPHIRDEAVSEEQLTTGRKELESALGADVWKQIEELAVARYEPNKEQKVDVDVTTLDKEKRTEIHKVFKKLFDGKLVSTTVNQPGGSEGESSEDKKFIRFMKPKNKRDQQRNRWEFPGEYVHFLVHKENLDTGEVAAGLAQRLGMKASQVNYCGTKDKRAKTTQKFCIKKRPPTQIVKAVRFIQNAKIGNFEFSKEVLKLGDLKGNRFRLALRYITSDQSQIEASMIALRERGFINYYGLQRFGNCATVPTYEVGLALLKSDYKLACELILKPRDNDANFLREIRETWWKNRDSAAAAAMFYNNKFIEKKVLDGLAQFGENDYSGALRKIPRNMLLLYTHAYQSLIFNRIASRRIKEYGLKLIPGDLVYRNKEETDANEPELPDDVEATEESVNETESDAKTETAEEVNSLDATNEIDSDVKTEGEQETESIFKRKVKPLTEADIASGNYTIFDVVLPLPGYDVTYPDNETGAWYTEFLAESGLTSEKLKHNVKTYALMGAYRKMVIQPNGLNWHFRKYINHEHALIASDWEQLKKIELPKEPVANEDALTALILEFSLPTAAYATMLLRELLKLDTSAMHQMQLELTALAKANAAPAKDEAETEKPSETLKELDNSATEKRKITDGDAEIETSANINKKLKECE